MMRRRQPLLLVTCFLFAVLVSAESRPPNVLLLVADDLGYAELGCQGNRDIPTPHIDSIARNGIRLTQGYVTAPVCCPSRAGLFTGKYQTRFGHELNAIGRQNLEEHIGLPLSETTLANELKSAGYKTGLVGKWHLGAHPKFHPQQRGFDEFFGFLHEGHFYVPPPFANVSSFLRTNELPANFQGRKSKGPVTWSTHLDSNEPPYDEQNPILRGTKAVVENEYLTDAFTRETVSFIRHQKQKPFFLCVAYNAPHSPMQAQPKYLERFKTIEDQHRRIFAAMVANLDDSVGAILGELRSVGLEENTLVFFLSDNGGPTAELTSSNHPLRGGKGNLFEGGIRVPFLIQWKGQLPAGTTYDQPIIALDIFATALAAANRPKPPGIDGVNLLPFLKNETSEAPHDILFWRYGRNIALRRADWKVVRHSKPRDPGDLQLFNLSKDAGETNDLASKHPDILKELTAILDKVNGEMSDPLWTPGAKRN